MPSLRPAILAAYLLGMLVPACSQLEPKPRNFTLSTQHPAKAEEEGNTLEAAELACKEETKRKGIASVLAILSRLRKGAADEDYVACMKRRGYEVKS